MASTFLGKRSREETQDCSFRDPKTTKQDLDTIYEMTLTKLMNGSRDYEMSNVDAENLCQSCNRSSGSVECQYCGSSTCEYCIRQCDACQDVYCGLCSINNYDNREDRVYCLDCYKDFVERKRRPESSIMSNSFSYAFCGGAHSAFHN